MAGGVVLLIVLTVLVSVIGGALVVHRRTQAAADLTALAAAAALQHSRDPCRAAHAAAELNDVTVTECDVTGEVVTVQVSRLAPRMFGRELVVRALARAGPQVRSG